MVDSPDVRFMSGEQHYEDALRRSKLYSEMEPRASINGMTEKKWLHSMYFPFEPAPDGVYSGRLISNVCSTVTDDSNKCEISIKAHSHL